MLNTLLEQRKYFDEKLNNFLQIKNEEERYNQAVNLVIHEDKAEFAYRSGLVRGKIIGLGLEEFTTDIVDGMNQTCSRVLVSDLTSWNSVECFQKISRANNDALMKFGLDYVDKWVMYNNLFKE